MTDWSLILGLAVAAVLAVGVALLGLAAFPSARRREESIFLGRDEATVFVFDGEALVDVSPGARALLNRAEGRGPPYLRMLAVLEPHFPDIADRLATLPVAGKLSMAAVPAHGTAAALHAELRGGLTRIVVQDAGTDAGLAGPDPMLHRAMTVELDQLRRIASLAPVPIWRERPDGEIVWANGDYLNRAVERLVPGEDLTWPLPRLFERTAAAQGVAGQRQKLSHAGGVHWFDLTAVAEDEGRLVYALPADAAVQAEQSLRDFMQTLTQTFAHLPIGLAIFDRNRQLHMFNPALLDLTGLPVDFLSLRPSLLSVLDALRDSKMLPEPKDYRDWRRQMIEMEKAAAAGLYEEMWSLSGGQTYRVMARPHPNGGLALMFEDVSTETLRTRRYRAQLDLSHAVLDAMDEAVVVFGQDGRVVMTNPAYGALWGRDPANAMAEAGYRDCCNDWRAATSPAAVWARAETYLETAGDRESWQAEARLTDGRLLLCRFAALPGGATLAAFRIGEPAFSPSSETPPLVFHSRQRAAGIA
ncbi:MAG: PAS-domain containing protein [Paracoccaceae bacterium]